MIVLVVFLHRMQSEQLGYDARFIMMSVFFPVKNAPPEREVNGHCTQEERRA
jgi:hypothetical protein